MKACTPLLVILFSFLISFSAAQTVPGIAWQNTIGGIADEILYSAIQTTDGGYLLGGYSESGISGDKTEPSQGSQDYWVLKLNDNGNIVWQNGIGGSLSDYLTSVIQTTDGGYLLGGYSNSGISGDKTEVSQGGYDYWIVKTDGTGNIVWQNTLGGSGDEILSSVIQTTDGGYLLGGYSFSESSGDKTENSHGLEDYWVVKLNSSGNIEWQNTIGGDSDDQLFSFVQTTDGGYFLGGFSKSGISGDKSEPSWGEYDFWVVKLDVSGNIEWQNTIGGSETDHLNIVFQTKDGGYFLGGLSSSGISGDKTEDQLGAHDCWVVKLDDTGNIEWQNTIGGSAGDVLACAIETPDDGFLIGVSSRSGISYDKTEDTHGGIDWWVLKLDHVGNILWQDDIGGLTTDDFHAMTQTTDGGYFIGGSSDSKLSGDKTEQRKGLYDYWVMKLVPDCSEYVMFADIDGDGFGDAANTYIVADCIVPGGYVYDSTDCNDSNPSVNPDATELCGNGTDDNCSGQVDENCGCDIPTGEFTSKITATSAKVSWNAVDNANKYTVSYRKTGTEQWLKGSATTISKKLPNLSVNTAYDWRVKSVCNDADPGNSNWSTIQNFTTLSLRIGDESLQQVSFSVYPNPAEDRTTIQFILPQSSHAYIKVYDVSGREIETLLDAEQEQGDHSLLLNTNHFSKGVYLVMMISEFGIENQKLIVQ